MTRAFSVFCVANFLVLISGSVCLSQQVTIMEIRTIQHDSQESDSAETTEGVYEEIGRESNRPAEIAQASRVEKDPRHDRRLNATLWMQQSVEYRVACEQAYALARLRIDDAISKPRFSAATEQPIIRELLPTAVILDVDETVLDNSPYQVRRILEREEYSTETWNDWVREEAAGMVPGAAGFIHYAQSRGVTVFFVTNRNVEVKDATVKNLRDQLGIPISDDQVLCRGEQPDWGSDKSSRRRHVAETHRVLLLIGDDYNDFVFVNAESKDARNALGANHQERWGNSWILIPNASYGGWERAAFDGDYELQVEERIQRMVDALDPKK